MTPDEDKPYVLWSVPAFSAGAPEVLSGAHIGSSKIRVAAGDVLVCKINPRINRVWLVDARLSATGEHIASPEWVALRPNDALVTGSWLRYFMSSPGARRWLESDVSGVTGSHTRVKPARVLATTVPVPPLDEQHRIVTVLDDHLSRLDAARTYLGASRRRATALRGAALDQLLSPQVPEADSQSVGCLSQSRREAYPLGAVRGRPQAAAPVDLPVPWDGRWPTVSLEQATHPVSTISYGILKPGPNVPLGVPYVRVVNMRGDVIDTGNLHRTSADISAQYARAVLRAGDVLLSIRGTYGRVCVVPEGLAGANITQDTARLALLPQVLPDFAATVLRSPWAQRYFKRTARGVAVKGVNIGDLREMPFPIPTRAEQQRVLAASQATGEGVQRVELAVEGALRHAEALRRGLLTAAFRGDL